jgi:hypothetical protein
LHAFETKPAKVQLFNEDIDHAYRVVLQSTELKRSLHFFGAGFN